MAEVMTRTSKGTVLEDMEANASTAFDVRSPSGLTGILQAARQAGLGEEAYAAFRDTVLEYAQGGGTDQELRKKIESVSASFTVKRVKVVEAPIEKATPAREGESKKQPHSFMGTTRPEPKFHLGAVEKPVPKIEKTAEAFVPPNLPVGEMRTVPVQSVSVEETPVQEPVPVSRPAAGPIQTVDQYKTRILEIKRTVNAQVGNPAVLMDGEDGSGREYMKALLAAMKAVSGTAPGTLQSSMERLEKAFIAVSNVGDTVIKKADEETVSVSPEPEATATLEKRDEEPEMKAPSTSSAPIQSVAPEIQIQEAKPEIVVPVARVVPQTAEPKIVSIPPKIQEPKSVSAIPAVSAKPPVRRSSAPIPPLTDLLKTAKEAPQTVGGTSPAVIEGNKHSAKGVGRSGFDVTIPGDVDTPVPAIVKDDLHAPEIDEGLDQLLHEWSLFAGAGLFGTGPGGREHPLFKKLGPLPMEMVIAGSWEGAGKDVILSIRDYANGWRHEQGVAYSPSESFEMYLRRIIKRIIKRQN